MMRIAVAAVGRGRGDPATAVAERYRERLLWPVEIVEVELKRPLPPAEAPAQEAQLLLAAVAKRASKGETRIVALDGGGTALDSVAFARKLGAWADAGTATAAFLIGGAYGHGAAVIERADIVLSLGPMTWPHLLARAMLMEQLYRAQQILAGHPYHHGAR